MISVWTDAAEFILITETAAKSDSKAELILEMMYEENMRDIAKVQTPKSAAREKRVGFFRDLATKYFT